MYKEISINASAILQQAKSGIIKMKMFERLSEKKTSTGLQIVTSEDNGVNHLSVFHSDRTPSFREVFEAKNYFFPAIEMAIYFPKGENVLSNVHHLWEVKNEE